ncbi:MAG TPA: SDR family NAD(P)-dependent oxidoreductase [Leptospiraceae bacterium]|nr:SDR family NAD(P)-dependent oxidoreductase [Leptospiraceae bacterium]HMY66778.1 SDR family NAD(P)-dependent oxidoreductase [Leptospiraceae bacterium]HNF12075.1 SDR family NAD(P)-dependent oxidoreductase [Leptospiraceae bacterium]HNF24662.1 SDR family NAD(P)-dependent oxidoreductase [Leptospiraceae bacterium]HNM02074.1 SDR family NAD(P)-dependent oxidoreductase [Leptospiraceae bacterium]
MKDKIVLITGSTGGIGFQTALTLASMNAFVVLHGRSQESGAQALLEMLQKSGNSQGDFISADLSSISGVRSLSADFQKRFGRLDVLIHNAGSAADTLRKTEDGLEFNFAVNAVVPYLLSEMLLKSLKKSKDPRIVTLTGGDLPGKLDLENLQCEKSFLGLDSYSSSKITMMCIMKKYSEILEPKGITCNICYPGYASTSMTQNVTKEMLPPSFRFLFPIFQYFVKPDGGKSAQKASRSTVYLASSDDFSKKTGIYCDKNLRIREMPKPVMDENVTNSVWEYLQRVLSVLDVLS